MKREARSRYIFELFRVVNIFLGLDKFPVELALRHHIPINSNCGHKLLVKRSERLWPRSISLRQCSRLVYASRGKKMENRKQIGIKENRSDGRQVRPRQNWSAKGKLVLLTCNFANICSRGCKEGGQFSLSQEVEEVSLQRPAAKRDMQATILVFYRGPLESPVSILAKHTWPG